MNYLFRHLISFQVCRWHNVSFHCPSKSHKKLEVQARLSRASSNFFIYFLFQRVFVKIFSWFHACHFQVFANYNQIVRKTRGIQGLQQVWQVPTFAFAWVESIKILVEAGWKFDRNTLRACSSCNDHDDDRASTRVISSRGTALLRPSYVRMRQRPL